MRHLKILILEDNISDAELVKYHLSTLEEFECEFRECYSEKTFHNILKEFTPDVIISDYNMNGYDGLRALEYSKKHLFNTPFIILTGTLGEELAVEIIKQGANNFILKKNVSRIDQAVLMALREAEKIRDKLKAEEELRNTLVNLEKMVDLRTAELRKTNQMLSDEIIDRMLLTRQLEEKNREMIDSINYAKHIQNAFTRTLKKEKTVINDFFAVDLPRNILSGDFHWSWYDKVNNCSYVALGDCTGHGVTGALMTILSVQLLEKHIIEYGKKIAPKQVVMALGDEITNFLRQTKDSSLLNHGMELVLMRIDFEEKQIYFTAIGRSIYHFRRDNVVRYKGFHAMVGGNIRLQTADAEEHNIVYESGDRIYTFSDGFEDQFGGKIGKKLLRKRKEKFLNDIQSIPFAQHGQLLKEYFEEWKGTHDQVDDVIMLGIEF